jgi:endonuclease/exonuclease/phosphatase family metal-dependent hydrolase
MMAIGLWNFDSMRVLWRVALVTFSASLLAGDHPDPVSFDPKLELREGNFAPLHAVPAAKTLRILDWNIDRGTELDKITESIRELHPDICVLQEVDLFARRSGRLDVANELARRLNFNFAFGLGFEELSQGDEQHPAYQGQATLTGLPIQSKRLLRFEHQTWFWKPEPYLPNWFFQRRLGGRVALVSEVQVARRTLIVYNLHLESRGVLATRFAQLQEVVEDAKRYPATTPVVLAGDLNTKYYIGRFADVLKNAGFHDCFDGSRPRTHRIIGNLDWILVRGPLNCVDARVVHDVRGSDHFAVEAKIELR